MGRCEKDIERSDVGVESSITSGAFSVCPVAAWSCCNCCC
jgi:hypothetical protein